MRLRVQVKAALLIGAVAAAASVTAPESAQAQGFFDFLFGGPKPQAPSEPHAKSKGITL